MAMITLCEMRDKGRKNMILQSENLFYIILVILVLLLLIGLICVIAVCSRKLRLARRQGEIDSMEGHDFEYYCAGLLEKQGFVGVEVTKASGDFGVDILAEKEGITYAIQCKRYQYPVGVEAVLRTYGGRDYYNRMVGVVMTNQYFTAPAVEAAKKLQILLWDRGYIDSMMEE